MIDRDTVSGRPSLLVGSPENAVKLFSNVRKRSRWTGDEWNRPRFDVRFVFTKKNRACICLRTKYIREIKSDISQGKKTPTGKRIKSIRAARNIVVRLMARVSKESRPGNPVKIIRAPITGNLTRRKQLDRCGRVFWVRAALSGESFPPGSHNDDPGMKTCVVAL